MRRFTTALLLATIPAAALSQTTDAEAIAEAQSLATLQATRAKIAQDRTTSDLATLAAIREAGAAGQGAGPAGGGYGDTAEAMVVARRSLAGAAGTLAREPRLAGLPAGPIRLVWGSVPPTGAYIQFRSDVTMLTKRLTAASKAWEAAAKLTAKPERDRAEASSSLGDVTRYLDYTTGPIPSLAAGAATASPFGVGLATALTLASLARVETTLNGLPVTVGEADARNAIAVALADRADLSEFDPFAAPDENALGLKSLVVARDAAAGDYGSYLADLAAVAKVEQLPAAKAAAGAELKAAIEAADALRRAAFTVTGGVSAASILLAGRQLLCGGPHASSDLCPAGPATLPEPPAVLYIRHVATAATMRTRKGVLYGLAHPATDFSATTVIDYVLARKGGPIVAGSVVNRVGGLTLKCLDATVDDPVGTPIGRASPPAPRACRDARQTTPATR